jgi:hypothetical protein
MRQALQKEKFAEHNEEDEARNRCGKYGQFHFIGSSLMEQFPIVTFAILPKYDNQYNMPMLKEACIWYAAAAGIMMLLCCIGYVNTVPQMGDKATWSILIMTILLSFGLPIIGWLINIVAMKNYGLTKERMVEVAKNVAGKKDQEVKEL